MKGLIILLLLLSISAAVSAQVNLFAEHQSMHLTTKKIYSDELYIDGYEPHRNEAGIEYKPNRWSYRLSFIDASNTDNGRPEYNHQGVTVGIKYCIAYCK